VVELHDFVRPVKARIATRVVLVDGEIWPKAPMYLPIRFMACDGSTAIIRRGKVAPLRDNLCPRCEWALKIEGDYLCKECR
jgi:hypothetical protein